MLSRREFLEAVAGSAVCTSVNASPLKHYVSPNQCLDWSAVRDILAGRIGVYTSPTFSYPWLDLSGFVAYEQDALDFLVTHIGRVEGSNFSFLSITGDAARSLVKLETYYFFLGNLQAIGADAAAAIGNWKRSSRPIRTISVREPLTVDVAHAFMAGAIPLTEESCDSPIDFHVPSISAEVANVLCRQEHEFYLKVLEMPLTVDTARELARHDGYSLWLYLEMGATDEVMAALSSNPAKHVTSSPGWTAGSVRVMINSEGWNAA
jgi:hypothetical protein